MRTVVRIGEFASPARTDDLHVAVDEQLDRLQQIWPDLTVERHRYRAPAHLLDFVLVIAEVRSEYRRHLEAAGCALTCEQAAAAAGGELLERLAQIRIHTHGVRCDSERNLCKAGHQVFDVAGYLGEPLFRELWPFPGYTPDLRLPRLTGRDTQSADPVLVPASLVANRWGVETIICEITTNGSASAPSQSQATEHAIRELAERDAMRVAWLRQQPMTQVDPPTTWARLDQRDQHAGWRTEFFTLPSVLGPPAWAVVTRHNIEPVFAIGTACTEDRDRGLEHALAEAVQGRLLGWLLRGRPRPVRVDDFIDHMTYYSSPEHIGAIDKLLYGREPADSLEADSSEMITGRDVPLAGAVVLPLLEHHAGQAVKVLAPGLQPAEANHDAARLVGRARRWRRSLLNTSPHPFG